MEHTLIVKNASRRLKRRQKGVFNAHEIVGYNPHTNLDTEGHFVSNEWSGLNGIV